MKISKANQILVSALRDLYDEREGEQIRSLFWEDLFHYYGGIDRILHTRELEKFDLALEQIRQQMPIQYVTSISHFYGLKLEVDTHVLIPRPETEELVYHVIQHSNSDDSWSVLDVGTGSACIAIALKNKRSAFDVTAIDVSNEALKIGRRNAERQEQKINFVQMDFLDPTARKGLAKYKLIVSNPPYISVDEKDKMSLSTLTFEPDQALFPDHEDVLIFYKTIAEFGKVHLEQEGRVVLECNEFNALEVRDIFENHHYSNVEMVKDMQGKDRILTATWQAS